MGEGVKDGNSCIIENSICGFHLFTNFKHELNVNWVNLAIEHLFAFRFIFVEWNTLEFVTYCV